MTVVRMFAMTARMVLVADVVVRLPLIVLRVGLLLLIMMMLMMRYPTLQHDQNKMILTSNLASMQHPRDLHVRHSNGGAC